MSLFKDFGKLWKKWWNFQEYFVSQLENINLLKVLRKIIPLKCSVKLSKVFSNSSAYLFILLLHTIESIANRSFASQ